MTPLVWNVREDITQKWNSDLFGTFVAISNICFLLKQRTTVSANDSYVFIHAVAAVTVNNESLLLQSEGLLSIGNVISNLANTSLAGWLWQASCK